MAAAKERFYEVDLARFIAAFMVLLFHFTFRATAADGYHSLPFPVLGPIFRYGYLGVDFFFIISGFVILLTASFKTPKAFVVSRFVRLYPNYWVGCLLTFLALTAFPMDAFPVSVPQFLVNLTMLQSFLGVSHIDSVYWSLVVELKFYLLTFIVMVLGLLRFVPVLLFGWMGLSLWQTHGVPIPYISFFFIPEWSSYFIAGCVFYLVRRDGMRAWHAVLLLLCLYLSLRMGFHLGEELAVKYGHEFHRTAIGGHIVVFYLFFLLFSLRRLGWLSHPRWMTIGALTYPLYLVHQRIGYMAISRLEGTLPPYVILTLVTAAMLLVSWIMHRYFERPFTPKLKTGLENLIRRVPDGKRP